MFLKNNAFDGAKLSPGTEDTLNLYESSTSSFICFVALFRGWTSIKDYSCRSEAVFLTELFFPFSYFIIQSWWRETTVRGNCHISRHYRKPVVFQIETLDRWGADWKMSWSLPFFSNLCPLDNNALGCWRGFLKSSQPFLGSCGMMITLRPSICDSERYELREGDTMQMRDPSPVRLCGLSTYTIHIYFAYESMLCVRHPAWCESGFSPSFFLYTSSREQNPRIILLKSSFSAPVITSST